MERGLVAVLRRSGHPRAGGHPAPSLLVDAIVAKRNLGTSRDDAPGRGRSRPGLRGRRGLPRGGGDHAWTSPWVACSTRARPLPNTGVPGEVGGAGAERVLRAPAAGVFHGERAIGDRVRGGDRVATIEPCPTERRTTGPSACRSSPPSTASCGGCSTTGSSSPPGSRWATSTRGRRLSTASPSRTRRWSVAGGRARGRLSPAGGRPAVGLASAAWPAGAWPRRPSVSPSSGASQISVARGRGTVTLPSIRKSTRADGPLRCKAASTADWTSGNGRMKAASRSSGGMPVTPHISPRRAMWARRAALW